MRNALPDSPEERYNAAHKTARSTIERCIGILKSRFRCILKERVLHYSPEKAGIIISACAVLHNIIFHHRLPYEEPVPEENEIADIAADDVPAIENVGHNIRQQLINNFFVQV